MKYRIAVVATLAVAGTGSVLAQAKDPTIAGIEKYREMLGDDNPAELYEARGEILWKMKAGPKNASLEKCDLGLGPGVVKGAYVQTPRYFADAGRVMDIETRINWCRTSLQGFSEADVRKRPFGSADKPSEIEDLVTYVVTASKGMKVNVPTSHPKEVEAYELGEAMFHFRAGPYDFSCASCHGESGKRIRLQDLPNLTTTADARRAYIGWPAYRVSTSRVHTMQWRINDCFRQQRFPEPKYMSEAVDALITYMAQTANGAEYKGPALKR
ncbi:MAG: sulfur oxidation c-type cytochrome SoxA [Sulfuritalea sp.]|nr:sulfur oxidation c-type cytochrome SoxA [Sulfuritalea sp.]